MQLPPPRVRAPGGGRLTDRRHSGSTHTLTPLSPRTTLSHVPCFDSRSVWSQTLLRDQKSGWTATGDCDCPPSVRGESCPLMPFCTIDHASCTIAPRICTIERRCPQPSLPRRSPARPKRCMFALDVRPSSRPRLSRCIPPACLPQSIAYLPHTLVNITMLALQPETHGREEDVPLEINHVQACCQ